MLNLETKGKQLQTLLTDLLELPLDHQSPALSKSAHVEARIAKFKRRFYSRIDEQIFEEAKGLLALAGQKFTQQRSARFLSRLILSQYFIRKALLKAITDGTGSRYVFLRILSSHLSSPFASKNVLGIFIGINFLHKYDVFTEEHLLRAFQKLKLDIQCIPEGLYSFQRQGEPFKFLYVEFEKKGKERLLLGEMKKLQEKLKEVLVNSVERLQPSVFMGNNAEEIIKNILLLSREIRLASDLPQAMIHFDEQTDKEFSFQIILVHVFKSEFSLQKLFEEQGVAYLLRWSQIVRYLRKKHPIQAHAFKLRVAKTAEIVRSDGSLNFYAARHQITELLKHVIGEFRDYNGGLILKQAETLTQFKQQFHEIPSEVLENFFYALTPIEAQATIPLHSLITLFQLFIEGKRESLLRPQDCFVKFSHEEHQIYCMFQAKEAGLLDSLKACLKVDPLISIQLTEDNRMSLGYLFESENVELVSIFQETIDAWKQKFETTKTLRLAISSGFNSLDPRVQGDEGRKVILKMLFEGLMRIDSAGQVSLGVAKNVKISKDRKKYTFKLRSTLWSNGTEVSADDFVYAWKTALSPHFMAPSAYLFYPIKHAHEIKEGRLPLSMLGVRAVDAKTLEIELESPIPYFLELLAQPQFSPVHSTIDQTQPTWPHQEGEGYVCNGAFFLKKNDVSQGYELIKNPSYHDAANIRLDRVSIKNTQIGEIREMFLRDEIDWLGFPAGMMDLPFLPIDQGEIIVLPNDSIYSYTFNTRSFPFNHCKLRQALALSIRRARILQALPPGHWPAFTILPFQHSRGPWMEESQQKGIALFKEAMQELNLNLPSFPPLKLLHAEGQTRDKIAQILKQEWEETFGIRCYIEAYSWKEIFRRLTEGNFQLCGMNWISLVDDPSYTLQVFHHTSRFYNFPGWCNQTYEEILNRANEQKQPLKRLEQYALAEEIFLQEVPVLPLIRTLPYSIKKSRVDMLSHSSMRSWDFKWASIRNKE